MNLQPLGDRLIVEVLEEEETTVSGIVLPDTAKEKPQRGKILAVGPGARDEDGDYIKMDVAVGTGKIDDNGKKIDLSVKVGDRVLFGSYAGNEVRINGEEYLIMREDEVLAVIETG